MNNRRLSYGLLLTFAAALAACGGDPPPPAETPAPPPAEPAPAAAEPTPPPAPAKVDPPPPPAKPAKEKLAGKFVQDFAGEVKETAEAAAKKAAGAADKDGKKFNAAMQKSQEAVATNQLEISNDTLTWSQKGKPVHKVKFEVEGAGSPTELSIKLGKDEQTKKDLKGQKVDIKFTDDNTFSMKDPFAAAGKGQTLVFKRQ
jgi:hypothetical protein